LRALEIAEVVIESALIDGAIKVVEKASSNELKRVERARFTIYTQEVRARNYPEILLGLKNPFY
jgi:hypothetical protein